MRVSIAIAISISMDCGDTFEVRPDVMNSRRYTNGFYFFGIAIGIAIGIVSFSVAGFFDTDPDPDPDG